MLPVQPQRNTRVVRSVAALGDDVTSIAVRAAVAALPIVGHAKPLRKIGRGSVLVAGKHDHVRGATATNRA